MPRTNNNAHNNERIVVQTGSGGRKVGTDVDRPLTLSERFASIHQTKKASPTTRQVQKVNREETRSPGVQKQGKTGGRGNRYATIIGNAYRSYVITSSIMYI
jgi:hypothetical protein